MATIKLDDVSGLSFPQASAGVLNGVATVQFALPTSSNPIGGVTKIVEGSGITISPSGGTGVVTINATGIATAPIAHEFVTAIDSDGEGTLAQPAFTDISGVATAAQLPKPTASTLGGIESFAAVTSEWINTISTSGVPSATQPAFTDISGTVAADQLPNPTASTLGGIESFAAIASNWINTISTSGVPSATQPAFTDIRGMLAQTQLPAAINAGSSLTIIDLGSF
jgi:uncharacterized protein YqgV (UPF0045/DUF77 family)